MTDRYRHQLWQCWLCGFKITPIHDPLALRVRFTNLHKYEDNPRVPWHEVFAHAECIAERMPKGMCFDPETLAEELDPECAADLLDNHLKGGVDFSLYAGLGGGLTLGLVPGDETGREDEAIHIKEDAFAVLEFCIEKRWPNYASGGHYGLSKIPSSVWIGIVEELKVLKTAIATATGVGDLTQFLDHLEYESALGLLTEIEVHFDGIKRDMVRMINELRETITRWCEVYPNIHVYGI